MEIVWKVFKVSSSLVLFGFTASYWWWATTPQEMLTLLAAGEVFMAHALKEWEE